MKEYFFISILLIFLIKPIYSQYPYPPTPLFPSEGSINVSITPEITWSWGGPYATTYVIGCGSWGIITHSPGSAIIPWENHLQPSTQYILTGTTWNDSNGQSAFGASNFTTGPIATLNKPSNGETEIRLNAIMRWGAVYPFPTEECVQISTNLDFINIILSDTIGVDELYIVPMGILQDSTTYYWRVADKLSGNWLPSYRNNFTTVKNPPGSPYLVFPMNGQTLSLTPLFDWDVGNIIYSTSKLWFMISEDINFSTLVYSDSSVVPTIPYPPSPSIWIDYIIPEGVLYYNKLYYFRLRAGNGVGWGGQNDLYYFYTSPPALPPDLLYPANGSTNIDLTPTLDWNDAEYFDKYWIEISKSTDNLSIILLDSTLTSSNYTVPSGFLSGNTTYYWKVCVKNIRGWGDFSSEFNFTTSPDVPASPILLAPINGAVNEPLTTVLDWSDVPLATSYNLQVSTDSVFISFILDDSTIILSQDTLTSGLLSNNTVYYWRVRGKNTSGWGNYSQIHHFTTIIPAPAAPILAMPIFGVVYTLTPLMDWGPPTAPGLTYRIQISTNDNFTSVILDSANIQTSFMDVPPGVLSSEMIYYWRVNATNAGGTSLWSDVRNFQTMIFVPILFSPSNGATNVSLTPEILWNFEMYATLTRLQISTDSIFGTTALDSVITSSLPNIIVPQGVLIPHQKYYWRVNMSFFGQTGPWSAIWHFTTGSDVPNAPLLLSPVNGAINQPVSVTFIWKKSIETLADKKKVTQKNNKRINQSDINRILSNYWFEYSTDSTFTSGVISDSSLIDTTEYISGLANNTKYFWKVKAKNESGWSNFSEIWSFTTVPSPPMVPILAMPIFGVVYTLTPLMDWGPPTAPGLTYRIQISINDNFTSVILDSANIQTSFMDVPPGVLSNETNYYWRVNATNAGGTSPWSDIGNFTVIVMVPVLQAPSNGATDVSLTPDIIWNYEPLSESYRMQISTDSIFGTTTLDSVISPPYIPIVTVPQGILTPHQKYYWRVNISFYIYTWPWSNIWNFTTGSDVPIAPILLYPVNGAINQPVNVTFTWRQSVETLADKKKITQKNNRRINQSDNNRILSNYWFEYSADSTFTSGVFRDSSLIDTTILVSGLNNNTKYFWRVKGMNQSGWGNFSSIWNLTTIPPIPLAPVLASPANGSADISLMPTLYWNNVSYASSYNVQLSVDSLFGATVLDSTGITNTNITIPSGKLTTLTKYYWRVSAVNAGGTGSYSSVWNFTTMPNFPNAPILSQPINNSVNQQTTITFNWYKAIETMDSKNITKRIPAKQVESQDFLTLNKYWFEYTTDSAFVSGIVRDSLLTDTTKTVSGLSNLTKYFWRVKGKNQTGWGIFSNIWNFTTVPPIPSAPILMLPVKDTTNVSLTPILDWNDVTCAESYRIQLAVDSLFNTIVFDTSNVMVSQLTVPIGKLTGMTRYYWKVKATNVAGSGSWSIIWNFRTLQILNLGLKVYLEGFWDGTSHAQDTVRIYLANPTTPHNYIDSSKVVLSTMGMATITFSNAQNGNYFIVIKHRNHIETWSAVTQSFITNVLVSYDFSTDSSKAYGNNMKKSGNTWMLFGGDPNQDGSIDAVDVPIFVSQFGSVGYLSCDFNGDWDVNAQDVLIIISNFGLTKINPVLILEPMEIRKQKQLLKQNEANEIFKKEKIKK